MPTHTQMEESDLDLVLAHRARALSPDHPVLRGTAQNPDVYFQARETVNPFYAACPEITQKVMDKFAQLVGRQYRLFEYHGAHDAERVIVLMGSGAEAVRETVDYLNARGEKVGMIQVRLYRPFDMKRLVEALPAATQAIAVLDRLVMAKEADVRSLETLAQSHLELAGLQGRIGRFEDSLASVRQAVKHCNNLLASDLTNPSFQERYAQALQHLGTMLGIQLRQLLFQGGSHQSVPFNVCKCSSKRLSAVAMSHL